MIQPIAQLTDSKLGRKFSVAEKKQNKINKNMNKTMSTQNRIIFSSYELDSAITMHIHNRHFVCYSLKESNVSDVVQYIIYVHY